MARSPGGEKRFPELYVEATAERVAETACRLIERSCPESGPLVLGVATGQTPVLTYRRLSSMAFASRIQHLVLLDEYVGLPPDDPRSFRSTISRLVAKPLGIPPARVHAPPAERPSADEFRRFEQRVEALGGVDVQLLGIGRNGHIAFNEPGSPLDSRTRSVSLAPETLADNANGFGGALPCTAVTQGIGTIMEARALVLLATGRQKANAVAAAVRGRVTAEVPASVLQTHPRSTIIVDVHAGSGLCDRLGPRPARTSATHCECQHADERQP